MKVIEHLDNNHKEYAVYDNYRSIASFVDGQKPSTRKIVHYVKNIKDFAKIDTLANNTSGATQYLHGAVNLEGVMKGMCQLFAGTNNIALIENEGYVGYRDEQEPGASRYVKARKAKIIDYIFRKEDEPILINQEFEGEQIEYKYYLPIIPLILINGSEGIGQGFAHKILARKPKEVIQYIFNYLDNKELFEILPYYNGFKTKITSAKDKQFNIIGDLEVVNTSTINITELPFTYDSSKYIKILNDLEDCGIVKSYIDKSSKNNFLFELKVSRASILNKDKDQLLNMFKLKTTITENYTLLDENNKITIFDNIEQIIEKYIVLRLNGYNARKKNRIKELEHEIKVLENKARFISDVNCNAIILKQKKSEIVELINQLNYLKVEGNYDYLFSITALNFTNEKVNELEKKILEVQKELEDYKTLDVKDIWKSELNELLKQLGENIKQEKIKTPKKETDEKVTVTDTKDILSLF